MRNNMGKIDRALRLLISVILVGVYFFGVVAGTWAIVILVFAGIMAMTSLISNCPLYSVLGINTDSKTKSF